MVFGSITMTFEFAFKLMQGLFSSGSDLSSGADISIKEIGCGIVALQSALFLINRKLGGEEFDASWCHTPSAPSYILSG